MNFGQALEALKLGSHVCREGWNGKNMHIYLEKDSSYTIPVGALKGERVDYEPVICMFTAQGKHQLGWLASQADMLAEDWMIKLND